MVPTNGGNPVLVFESMTLRPGSRTTYESHTFSLATDGVLFDGGTPATTLYKTRTTTTTTTITTTIPSLLLRVVCSNAYWNDDFDQRAHTDYKEKVGRCRIVWEASVPCDGHQPLSCVESPRVDELDSGFVSGLVCVGVVGWISK